MGFFKLIEGDGAVVVERGVYKQVKLYERDGYIYAQAKGGFVRVMADGSTSALGGNLRLDYMSFEGALAKDQFGKLCRPSARGAKPIDGPAMEKLLGAPE